MIITHDGMIIRQTVKEISSIGRNTQGVRLINLTKGDKVHDITRVPPEDADDESLDKEVEELKKAPKLNLKDLVESDVDQKDDFGGEIEDDTDIDDSDDSEDSDD
jgi:DNA gyrase subunit A